MILLFVPADRPERFARAVASGADAAILDLEDAVAAPRRPVARENAYGAFAAGLEAYVRVNPPASEDGRRDLAMLRSLGELRERSPEGVMIAKAGSAEDVAIVRAALPQTRIVALVESIDGIRNIEGIARSNGVSALAFGGYDLCADLGARPTPEVLAPWRAHVVLTARWAGIEAIDTPYLALDDETGLRDDARRAVDFGFDGKLAVHPRQIGTIRAAFAPNSDELVRARAIVVAAGAGGVTVYEGTMIDGPVISAARRVLARAGEVE